MCSLQFINSLLRPSYQILTEEKPSLIASGHYHDALYFTGLKTDMKAMTLTSLNKDSSVHNFSLSSDHITELVVPTCSYRMGKQQYGFGLAVISEFLTLERLQEF